MPIEDVPAFRGVHPRGCLAAQGAQVISRHADLYAREAEYWWSVVRRREILRLVKKFSAAGEIGKTLDLGCGGGELLAAFKAAGINSLGVDYSYVACCLCSGKGLSVVNADAARLPFRDNLFSLVLALDLLEHLPQEAEMLSEINRVCRKGAIVLFAVPAFNCLRGRRDSLLGHYRRYTGKGLEKELSDCGLRPFYGRYMFCGLFLLLLSGRLVPRLGSGSEVFACGGIINSILRSLFLWETMLGRLVPLPFGTSFICAARKC